MTATATAHCLKPGCGWTAEGDPDAVDKAAAKHVSPGHATGVVVRRVTG